MLIVSSSEIKFDHCSDKGSSFLCREFISVKMWRKVRVKDKVFFCRFFDESKI